MLDKAECGDLLAYHLANTCNKKHQSKNKKCLNFLEIRSQFNHQHPYLHYVWLVVIIKNSYM
jgi:hypothetical protein